MILVAGPRIDGGTLPSGDGLEVRGCVHRLYRHLAACDLAIAHGGLSTTMELTESRAGVPVLPARAGTSSRTATSPAGWPATAPGGGWTSAATGRRRSPPRSPRRSACSPRYLPSTLTAPRVRAGDRRVAIAHAREPVEHVRQAGVLDVALVGHPELAHHGLGGLVVGRRVAHERVEAERGEGGPHGLLGHLGRVAAAPAVGVDEPRDLDLGVAVTVVWASPTRPTIASVERSITVHAPKPQRSQCSIGPFRVAASSAVRRSAGQISSSTRGSVKIRT